MLDKLLIYLGTSVISAMYFNLKENNMKFKLITYPLLSAAVLLLSSQTIFASHEIPPKPEKCPSVRALNAVGVNSGALDTQLIGWLAGNNKSNYDTKDEWSFIIRAGGDKIINETDAMAKGNALIATLSPDEDGPQLINLMGDNYIWGCYYWGERTFAAAVTPATLSGHLSQMMSMFMKR